MTDPRPAQPDSHDNDHDDDRHDAQPAEQRTGARPDPRGVLFISDLQALRRADRVSFHHHDGHGYIHAELTTWPRPEPRIYTPTEQRLFPDPDGIDRRRRIDVDTAVAGFDDSRHWHERALPAATASHVINAARLDEVWRSITALLRVGDILGLHWRAGNNTEQVAAGLDRDELRVAITRGRHRWEFLVAVSLATTSTCMVTRNHER